MVIKNKIQKFIKDEDGRISRNVLIKLGIISVLASQIAHGLDCRPNMPDCDLDDDHNNHDKSGVPCGNDNDYCQYICSDNTDEYVSDYNYVDVGFDESTGTLFSEHNHHSDHCNG